MTTTRTTTYLLAVIATALVALVIVVSVFAFGGEAESEADPALTAERAAAELEFRKEAARHCTLDSPANDQTVAAFDECLDTWAEARLREWDAAH